MATDQIYMDHTTVLCVGRAGGVRVLGEVRRVFGGGREAGEAVRRSGLVPAARRPIRQVRFFVLFLVPLWGLLKACAVRRASCGGFMCGIPGAVRGSASWGSSVG